MWDYPKLLFTFYRDPRRAVSESLDQARLGAVVVLAVLAAAALQLPQYGAQARVEQEWQATNVALSQAAASLAQTKTPIPQELTQRYMRLGAEYLAFRNAVFSPAKAITELFLVMAIFVPVGIAIAAAVEGRGVGRTISQEFGPVMMCTALAWSAARIPAIPLALYAPVSTWAYLASTALFLFFAVAVFQTTLGARWLPAGASAIVGGGVLAVIDGLGVAASPSLFMLGSPWLLYYFWGSLSSGATALGSGISSRQSFQRALQATTLNPRDADAHAQLGHIQMKRRNWKEAETRFRTAVTIDPEDAEYAFYLGCALREQGKEAEAKTFLARAASFSDKTSNSEVLRELGAAQMGVGEWAESLTPLKRYVERREYDPIGLVYLGESLEHANDHRQARELFERAVEAVKTMPNHRRGELRRWASRAQGGLKRVGRA